ncbi:MAG: peroxidase, partial [Gammaproteobacteria bacterium]|nr:peroxidase [Gammaproteobacteria bacterium]
SNVVALGEFVLGYHNEYGKITDRPLLEPDAACADLLPALDAPEKKDLGRNGTYLVLRQLEQDVRGFWQFVHQQAGGNDAAAQTLAAAMVGRTRAGDPLVPLQAQLIPGIGPDPEQIRQNQFTFDQDPAGARCPFGAHVRRANPRNTDFPGRPTSLLKKLLTLLCFGPKGFRDDLMSSVRFHRILRRGREYGCELKPEHALAPTPPDDPSDDSSNDSGRGLHFICLNANISRQFEFVQNAWMASSKFSGLTDESDPLLGNRQPLPGCPATHHFTVQRDGGLRRRVTGLPQFVTVRGGAYFFLPSLRALRYVAGTAPVHKESPRG